MFVMDPEKRACAKSLLQDPYFADAQMQKKNEDRLARDVQELERKSKVASIQEAQRTLRESLTLVDEPDTTNPKKRPLDDAGGEPWPKRLITCLSAGKIQFDFGFGKIKVY